MGWRLGVAAVGVLTLAACSGSSSSSKETPDTTVPVAVISVTPTTSSSTTAVEATTSAVPETTTPAIPESGFGLATFAFGAQSVSVFDLVGHQVGTIDTAEGALLTGAVPTSIPGRMLAVRPPTDGRLLVLDVPTLELHEVPINAGTHPHVLPVGAGGSLRYAFVFPEYASPTVDLDHSTTSLIDLESLEVVDLRATFGLDDTDTVYPYNLVVSPSGNVALTVGHDPPPGETFDEFSSARLSSTFVFDLSSPDRFVELPGYVSDITDEALVMVRPIGTGDDAEMALMSLDGTITWTTAATPRSSGAILENGRVLVVSRGSVVIASPEDGSAVPVDELAGADGVTWIGARQSLLVFASDGATMLSPSGDILASYGMVYRFGFDLGATRRCWIVGAADGTRAQMVDAESGAVKYRFRMAPTIASQDACSTGSDKETPGELVLDGTEVPLADGEVVAAISPDGSAALVLDRSAKRAVIRTAAGPSADVVLPEIVGGVFVQF